MAGELQKQIIAAGYKQLAKKAHPDHHGTAEEMIALNAARDRLLDLIRIPGDNIHAAPPRYVNPSGPQPPRTVAEVIERAREIDPTIGVLFDIAEILIQKPPKRRKRGGKRA